MQLSEEQRAKVFQSLGQASMCWTEVQNAGVFMSELAIKTGEELIGEIESWNE